MIKTWFKFISYLLLGLGRNPSQGHDTPGQGHTTKGQRRTPKGQQHKHKNKEQKVGYIITIMHVW